ncbi:PREDICTED: acyl-CoA synthetase family member 3, mitochondrial-like [Priapulus caudatus]|uniref:Acyl-CoA synthetase family member 3, mitochondrial-like n=1 Tax=Priapulus caudatus TaxID=37621 RepID=A0ABM1E0F5_PRICU|nr:PREDICTED: acyl-CoA synthetase family member 3, mitochondrial-like [Priapulus caudatus]XP_014665677.1 PREDICTED: acyl-CoA synthetase family member 3, mitochondrial-like [Priapulus caudatus]
MVLGELKSLISRNMVLQKLYVTRKLCWALVPHHLPVWKFRCGALSCVRAIGSTHQRTDSIFVKAAHHGDKAALVDSHGVHTYKDLLKRSEATAQRIRHALREQFDIKEARVAVLCPPDVSYVTAQWGCWMAGGVFVPLHHTHPTPQLAYFIADSRCSIVLTTKKFSPAIESIVESRGLQILHLDEEDQVEDAAASDMTCQRQPLLGLTDEEYASRRAMIVYTSGTTGPAKGVVLTHANLQASMMSMIQTWKWTRNDVCLHVLPLNHVHGIINALMTPLYCGATCVMLPEFNAPKVWFKLLSTVDTEHRVNVFHAVPTVYAKLIEDHEARFQCGISIRRAHEYIKAICSEKVRLMVCGSAALPQPILRKWKDITGHTLLERYGMTEVGMALSNPLHGTRTPGSVGNPMPGVEVCIARPNFYSANGYDAICHGDDRKTVVAEGMNHEVGELYVRGPAVFKEYWDKPSETEAAFTKDGWFKTGDTAQFENGMYKILGRTSVDIIKSGGYKISALDVERDLLQHVSIVEAVVVGLPDITWGQRVAALLVMKDGVCITAHDLKAWGKSVMASYSVPSIVKCVESIPRNNMGKVNKKQIQKEYFPEYFQ